MTGVLASQPRSVEAMANLVEKVLDPEHSSIYQPEDLNGDGHPETKCNWYLHDWSVLASAPIPKLRANDQIHWLRGGGGLWRMTSAAEAVRLAGKGRPAVVGWINPEPLLDGHGNPVFENGKKLFRPGHVATVRATPAGASGVWISQAGAHCYNLAPLIKGFGHHAPLHWFEHD